MSVIALDSSSMVAAVCSWHERHAVVAADIERRLLTLNPRHLEPPPRGVTVIEPR